MIHVTENDIARAQTRADIDCDDIAQFMIELVTVVEPV